MKVKKNSIIQLGILGALIAISYIPTFKWMVERWSVKDTYYSHGFLVPFVSIFIAWSMRKELSTIKAKPDKLGWLLLIPGLSAHLISVIFQISFISGFALLPIISGLILLFFGEGYLKKLLFPIGFLSFMVPLPEVLIVNLSFRLKIFAAQISTLIVNQLGIAAVREGSAIKTAHSLLMVEDPCSGIRSLIALIALGALMAYRSGLSRNKKWVVFLASLPIAISTNIFRIVSVTIISEIYGQEFGAGAFHDFMGFFVFVLAFFGLLLVNKLLE